MIDTKRLEEILSKTRADEATVHPSVVKVGKSPQNEVISILGIETHSDAARLILRMEWDVSRHVSQLHTTADTISAHRLKWFNQVVKRLNFHAKETDIKFFVDPDTFEFGVRGVSGDREMVVLWAEVIALAFQGKIPGVN
jgi:hypothetical protein